MFAMTTMINRRPALSTEELRGLAPSVFATHPQPGVSHRYAFVPTANIVDRLRGSGWSPVEAREQTIRLDDRRGFQKHLLRFRRQDVSPVAGEYTPELVLINSHDRSSAYLLHAGIFRFVCSNGLVVSDSTFGRVCVRHSGFTPDEITEASFKLLDEVPTITARVDKYRARLLSEEESTVFATLALRLRFQSETDSPISPAKLLETRRTEDSGSDLWRVLNRVHEHLLQGGQKDYSRRREDGRRFSHPRRHWSGPEPETQPRTLVAGRPLGGRRQPESGAINKRSVLRFTRTLLPRGKAYR